ncbi:hypothetical protein REPUB_Repub02eG0201500 [Reevesia pubescens]
MEKTIPIRNEGREAAANTGECSEWRSKAEEYDIVSNLTGFDNLRAMMEGEATVNRRKRRRRRRKKKLKNNNDEFQFHAQQLFPVDAAIKEIKMIEPLQALKSRTEGNIDEARPKEFIDLCSSSSYDDGLVSNISSIKSNGEMASVEATVNEDTKTVRREELKSIVAEENVEAGKKEMHAEKAKCVETVKSPEKLVENTVLRMLLRKPRYYDLPSGSWASCLSCGEDHPTAANCRLQKQVKACYLCGSLQHTGQHCAQGQYSFVCRGTRNQVNDWPEKQEENNLNYVICLRCGDSGHDMFSCRSDYSLNDLKEIRCYVCQDFGHLNCVKLSDTSPAEVSCYNCGQFGHLGSECSKCPKVAGSSKSPTLCYRCREEGHFARTCTLSRKHARRVQAKMRRSLGSSSAPPKCGPQNDSKDTKGEIQERLIIDIESVKMEL